MKHWIVFQQPCCLGHSGRVHIQLNGKEKKNLSGLGHAHFQIQEQIQLFGALNKYR